MVGGGGGGGSCDVTSPRWWGRRDKHSELVIEKSGTFYLHSLLVAPVPLKHGCTEKERQLTDNCEVPILFINMLSALCVTLLSAALRDMSLSLKATVTNVTTLAYPVESRTYPEAPDLLVVTNRGGGFSVWNTSEASSPRCVHYWRGFDGSTIASVEGQDRMDDLLVVAELGDKPNSALITVDANTFASLARLPLSTDGALHVKLYRTGGLTYALITCGLTHNTTARSRVVAVDVTNPRQPKEVATVEVWKGRGCAEGVFVVEDVAFIGSYCTSDVATISLKDLPSGRLSVINATMDSAYENMVSARYNESYGDGVTRLSSATATSSSSASRADSTSLLFSASYAAPGGLVIFDTAQMSAAGEFVEVGRLITHNSSRSNRVHLRRDLQMAFLALEKADDGGERGGVAIVDVSAPENPQLLLNQSIPSTTSRAYCLSTKGRFLYVFAAMSHQMYVYEMQSARSGHRPWPLSRVRRG
jgi:hypothetical protein